MLFNTLRMECRKAICNKFFLLAITIGCVITLFSLVPRVQSYYNDMAFFERMAVENPDVVYNPLMPIETLFSHWIGGEPVTSGSAGYFFLFPLLIAVPFGWSYCAERRSGYVKNVVIRSGRLRYYFAKYVALFLSGGLAMIIPLLFNFLVAAMFVPAVLPDPSYVTAYGVNASSFLGVLFYYRPFLYVFLYFAIDFIFCGLIACLCFSFAALVKNRVVITLLPFFIILGFHYFCYSFIFTSPGVIYTELSPMYFLRPAPAAYNTNGLVVAAEAAILFAATFVTAVLGGRKREIY